MALGEKCWFGRRLTWRRLGVPPGQLFSPIWFPRHRLPCQWLSSFPSLKALFMGNHQHWGLFSAYRWLIVLGVKQTSLSLNSPITSSLTHPILSVALSFVPERSAASPVAWTSVGVPSRYSTCIPSEPGSIVQRISRYPEGLSIQARCRGRLRQISKLTPLGW